MVNGLCFGWAPCCGNDSLVTRDGKLKPMFLPMTEDGCAILDRAGHRDHVFE